MAQGAGLVGQDATLDPYADDVSFLLAGFISEDVCVTTLEGAAPLLRDPANAAGLLGAEGHHAAALRCHSSSGADWPEVRPSRTRGMRATPGPSRIKA